MCNGVLLGRVPSVNAVTYLFGGLCHIASCGTFEGNGMLGILRDVNNLSFKLNLYCFVLYLIVILLLFLFLFHFFRYVETL